jgi:hypothetical protein
VLPEHGFILAKDGILYVKSCNMQNPVLVDEEPMPPEWLAVPLPASLVFGRVTIVATAESGMYEEDAATMMGKPSQLVFPVKHEAGGADFSEDQPTLIKRDPPERPRPSAPPTAAPTPAPAARLTERKKGLTPAPLQQPPPARAPMPSTLPAKAQATVQLRQKPSNPAPPPTNESEHELQGPPSGMTRVAPIEASLEVKALPPHASSGPMGNRAQARSQAPQDNPAPPKAAEPFQGQPFPQDGFAQAAPAFPQDGFQQQGFQQQGFQQQQQQPFPQQGFSEPGFQQPFAQQGFPQPQAGAAPQGQAPTTPKKSIPPIRIAIFVLVPLALLALVPMIRNEVRGPQPPASATGTSTSTSTARPDSVSPINTVSPVNTVSPINTAARVTHILPNTQVGIQPDPGPGPVNIAPAVTADAGAPSERPTAIPRQAPPPTPAGAKSANLTPTKERLAADMVASGRYGQAAAAYRELAQEAQDPNRAKVFNEAARILDKKALLTPGAPPL